MVCSHTRFGSIDFAEQCDFNRNPRIFSNRHRWRQRQYIMFSRLCKQYLRSIYTSDFRARFRSKLADHFGAFLATIRPFWCQFSRSFANNFPKPVLPIDNLCSITTCSLAPRLNFNGPQLILVPIFPQKSCRQTLANPKRFFAKQKTILFSRHLTTSQAPGHLCRGANHIFGQTFLHISDACLCPNIFAGTSQL